MLQPGVYGVQIGVRRILLAVAVLLVAAGAAAVWAFSGVTLAADGAALGRVELQPFAGSLESVRAEGPDGRAVPLVVSHGRPGPRTKGAPGGGVTLPPHTGPVQHYTGGNDLITEVYALLGITWSR